jgi:predicted nucleotide-binding protein
MFSALAAEHPVLWRRLALELADRLRQRGGAVKAPNDRPVVFIGSSSERLDEARLIQDALEHDPVSARLWTDGGVFGASRFPIDELLGQVATADFAVLVLAPDDQVVSRRNHSEAPRDNAVFELGLFMGALGRDRTLFVVPRDVDVKVPTDLLGLTSITYRSQPASDVPHSLATAANHVRRRIEELGVR